MRKDWSRIGILAGLFTLVMAVSPAHCEDKPKDTLWVKNLPGGTVVELLGVAYQFPRSNEWFTPAGAPLAEAPVVAPPHILISPEDETKIMQFAVRVKAPAGSEPNFTWQFDPKGTRSIYNLRRLNNARIAPDRLWITNEFLTPQANCTIRFGVATGPWKTISQTNRDGSWTPLEKPRIMFGKAHNIDGRTLIAVSYSDIQDDVRVVLLDDADKAQLATKTHMEGEEGNRLLDLEFDFPPNRGFYFQTRPYQWVTFKDVALMPKAGK
jgi:hypothetical protein